MERLPLKILEVLDWGQVHLNNIEFAKDGVNLWPGNGLL